MDEIIGEEKVIFIKEGKRIESIDKLALEKRVSLFLNGECIFSTLCSPAELEELMLGHLYSEGYIQSISEIKNMHYRDGAFFVDTKREESMEKRAFKNPFFIKESELFSLMDEFNRCCKIFFLTAGVHGAALASKEKLILFAEDIGRQNAIDKVIGKGLKKNIKMDGLLLLSSGRVASDAVKKAVRIGLNGILSIGAPTKEAVNEAKNSRVLLVGFIRERRANIYSGAEYVC